MIVIRLCLWLIAIGIFGLPVLASFALDKQPLIDRQAASGAGMLALGAGVRARVVPAPRGVVAGITARLPLPENPLGTYLNIRMALESGAHGAHIRQMSVGSIDVPEPLVRPVFALMMDQVAGAGQGSAFLDRVGTMRSEGSAGAHSARQR